MSKKSGKLPIGAIGRSPLWSKNGRLGCCFDTSSVTDRRFLSEVEVREREKESARLAGFLKELGYE